jgi:hypothetical protein
MNSLDRTLFLAGVFLAFTSLRPVFGQTQASTISVNTFRPLAAVADQLQQLSQIPINYEDVRCDFPGDQTTVQGAYTAAQQALASQNGVVGPLVDIAPRGGPLSATIAVNASRQLPNAPAVASALNSFLSSYSGSTLPGAFSMEAYNGAFFLAPTSIRNQTGTTVLAPAVLSTPITLSVNQGVAFQVLDQILAQVSQTSGFKIGVGTVPVNALAMARVTINAVQEPANHILMWLLNSLLNHGQVLPASSPSLAYRVLYDPKLKYYMFNIVEVGVGFSTRTLPPVAPTQPSGPNRWSGPKQ